MFSKFKKNKVESEDYDLNFDTEDFDFGDDEFDDTGRKPSLRSRAKRLVTDELDAAKYDNDLKRRLAKSALPSDYSYAIDAASSFSNDASEILREQKKEWEKVRGDVKKSIKPFGVFLDKFGASGLKRWAEEAERSSSSMTQDQEALDTLSVQNMIGEVFGQQLEQQQKRQVVLDKAKDEKDDENKATEAADRQRSYGEQVRGSQLLTSINDHMSAQRGFTENVSLNWMKKGLEIKARSLLTQQRMLQVLTLTRTEQSEALKNIQKNTGLPDYLKINASEMTQQAVSAKLLEQLTSPFDGKAKNLGRQIKAKIQTSMREKWKEFGAAIQMFSDQSEGDSNFIGTLGSSAIGGAISNKAEKALTKYLTPKIRKELERRGIAIHGANMRAIIAQAPDLFQNALKTGDFGSSAFGKLLEKGTEFFDIRAQGANRQVLDRDKLDLEKAAFMDNRMRLTIVDVIPAWLKKIFSEVFKFNSKGKAPPDQDYDFLTGRMVDNKELTDRAIDSAINKDAIKNRIVNIDNWLDELDPQVDGAVSLSPATRDFIRKWASTRARGSDSLDPLLLLSANDAPANIKSELTMMIPRLLKLPQKAIDEIKERGLTDNAFKMIQNKSIGYANKKAKLADLSTNIRSSTEAIDQKQIAQLIKDPNMRKALLDKGLITLDASNRVISINPEALSYFDDFYKRDESKLKRHQYKYNGDDYERVETGRQDIDLDNYKRQKQPKGGTWHLDDAYRNMANMVKQRGERSGHMFNDEKPIPSLLVDGSTLKDVVIKNEYVVINAGSADETLIPAGSSEYALIHQAASKAKHSKGLYSRFKGRGAPFNRFAAGGHVPSYAKGGPTANINPDKEINAKLHGGEFVVENDATKFNKQVLEAINKVGAPLIKGDKTINSAYYKLFGFKSANEFEKSMSGVKSQAGAIVDKGMDETINKIFQSIDIRFANPNDIRSITDIKVPQRKRLENAMRVFAKQQQQQAKKDPKGYAKGLAQMGISSLGKGFDSLLDTDGSGVNVEIKNQLLAMAGAAGGKGKDGLMSGFAWGKDKAGTLAKNLKGRKLNTAATNTAVSTAVAESENPKRFNTPLDLYFKGRNTPFVTRQGFKKGEYIDKMTGNVIRNPSQITGTIIDLDGNEIASTADLVDNEILTGSRKKYTLMGMQESNRRYDSVNDMAAKNFAALAGIETIKKRVEQAKELRDKFILDQPVDIYTRDNLLTPVLHAGTFKEGHYQDVNTGNMLWTHHDITGPVKNVSTGNIALTQEQLDAGLFDKDGKRIKISKIKQYRNMAFKRGAEVYQKYASKHVNKLTGGILNKMSAMGEKHVGMNYDKNPIDVYVAGESKPRVTAAQFKVGVVFCGEKNVLSHSSFDGDVYLMTAAGDRSLAVSVDEFKSLVDANGEKLKIPLMMSAGARFKDYLKEAMMPSFMRKKGMNFLRMSKDKRDELGSQYIRDSKLAEDIYLEVDPNTPIMTKKKFLAGEYLDKETGKPVYSAEMIKGPVIDKDGNLILSEEDLKKTFVNYNGEKVRFQTSLLGQILGFKNLFSRGKTRLVKTEPEFKDVYVKGDKDPVFKAKWFKSSKYARADNGLPINKYADLFAGVVDDKGNKIISDEELAKGLVDANGIPIKSRVNLRGMLGGLANKLRVGSWQWLRANKKDKDGKDDKDKDGKEKKKKFSFLGMLGGVLKTVIVGPILGALGLLLGGWKAALHGTIKLLGKGAWALGSWMTKRIAAAIAAKTAGSALGGLFGGGGPDAPGRKRGGKLGKIGNILSKFGGRGKLAAAGLAAGAGYLGYKHFTDDEEGEPIGVDENGEPIFASQAKGDSNAQAAQEEGGVLNFLKNAMPKDDDGSVDLGALGLGAALMTTGFRPIKTAKGLYKAAKATRLPSASRMAKIGSGAWKLGKGALRIGRVLTPWGLGLTAAMWAGGKVYDMWKDSKSPWNKFRMAQYGFDHNDSKVKDNIAKIEELSTKMISVTNGKVSLNEDEATLKEILKICGLMDGNGTLIESESERAEGFMIWYKERFLRVYASYLSALQKIKGKAEMIDLNTLDRDQQRELLKSVHFVSVEGSPYVVVYSPFAEPKKCEYSFVHVAKFARNLESKIAHLPEPPAKAAGGTDELNGNLSANTANKSPADRAMDNELDVVAKANAELDAVKESPMSAAEKALRITQIRQEAMTKASTATMIATAEEVTAKQDGIFSTFISKMKSGISSFGNWHANVMSGAADAVGLGSEASRDQNSSWLERATAVGQSAMGAVGATFTGKVGTAEQNLVSLAMKAGVTDPTEMAMFLAQTAHESGGFKWSKELGKDSYFNRYNGRKDLGNTQPGDGPRYKGRGWIQVTGRANYAKLSKDLGIDFVSKPELLEKEPYASMAAVWFWTKHSNMTRRGRAAAQRGDVLGATKAVNGGTNGLADRKQRYAKYSQMIGKDLNGWLAKNGGGVNVSAPSGGGTTAPATSTGQPSPMGLGNAPSKAGSQILANSGVNVKSAMGAATGNPSTPAGIGVLMSPAQQSGTLQQKAAAMGGNKGVVFIGDSIAHGYGNAYKGAEVRAVVGANPTRVLGFVKSYLQDAASKKGATVYLSSGWSNDTSQLKQISEQFSLLKNAGISAKILGVSFSYPKANPVQGNKFLKELAIKFGHQFLGGFVASGDKVHPKSYSTLPSGGRISESAAPDKMDKATINQIAASAVGITKAATTNGSENSLNVIPPEPGASADANQNKAGTVGTGGNNPNGDWDVGKMARHVRKHANGTKSLGKCAGYVRRAMDAGDVKKQIKKIGGVLGDAKHFEHNLPRVGWVRLGNLETLTPEIGDIVVFPGYGPAGGPGRKYGHVAMFDGKAWISDFIQNSAYPNLRYAKAKIHNIVFRPGSSTGANTVISDDAGINGTMNGISDGSAGTLGGGENNSGVIPQDGAMGGGGSFGGGGGDAIPILGDILVSVRRMAAIMEHQAQGTGMPAKPKSVEESPKFDPQTGKPLGGAASVKEGVTTPNIPKSTQPQDNQFTNVPNPVDVRKP